VIHSSVLLSTIPNGHWRVRVHNPIKREWEKCHYVSSLFHSSYLTIISKSTSTYSSAIGIRIENEYIASSLCIGKLEHDYIIFYWRNKQVSLNMHNEKYCSLLIRYGYNGMLCAFWFILFFWQCEKYQHKTSSYVCCYFGFVLCNKRFL